MKILVKNENFGHKIKNKIKLKISIKLFFLGQKKGSDWMTELFSTEIVFQYFFRMKFFYNDFSVHFRPIISLIV